MLRIEEARAQRGVTTAAWWPSLSANAGYSRTRLSETTAHRVALFSTELRSATSKFPARSRSSIPAIPYNQYQLGADVSWEPDLFGRVRRSVEVADAGIEVSVEDQHAVLVSLLGDVAQTYVDLRGAQLQPRPTARARSSPPPASCSN